MDLSVIIPIKDERDNLSPLSEQVREALTPLGCAYEVIFVDDGSMDGSFALLEKLAAADRRVKVVRLRRNFGQTAALQAGIDWSSGDILVTLDGDLQNDPADILVSSKSWPKDMTPSWDSGPSVRTMFSFARFPVSWAIG